MLRFEVHEIRLDGRCYLPLPKLSGEQMRHVAAHLEARGYSVRRGPVIRARRGPVTVSVDPIGLAHSSESLLDALAPAVPGLLSFGREPTSTNPYYEVKKVRDGFAVRLSTRMEHARRWSELRASGQCGLTPDERLVVQELLGGVNGEVRCVTDYPTTDSSILRAGRRNYYLSEVSLAEFTSNLRGFSHGSARGCYLPRRSTLTIRSAAPGLGRVAKGLGEWCFLCPTDDL